MSVTPLTLPLGGSVDYSPGLFSFEESHRIMAELRSELPWQKEELMMFGKRLTLEREVVWCADPGLSYTYSGKMKQPSPWTPGLQRVRERVEAYAGERFNACLLNFYPDGAQGMSWHSDDEASIEPASTIASLSFGAERKFVLKPKGGGLERYAYLLASGSVLLMKGEVQKHYLHSLPKSTKVHAPRLNLTFRRMIA